MTNGSQVDRFDRTSRDVVAVFAAGCASRLTPVFVEFCSGSQLRWNRWLEELWASVAEQDDGRCAKLLCQIEGAPEARIDDSNRPDYYAMRALGVLAYAVRALVDVDFLQQARYCADSDLALLRTFDYILGWRGTQEALEDLEARFQRDEVDRLVRRTGDPIGGGELRRAAESVVAVRLRDATTMVAEVQGWRSR